MKRFLIIILSFSLMFLCDDRNSESADIAYDNFDKPYLDGTKWWPREYVRKVEDGRLILKLGNSSGMGAEVAPGIFRNNLDFANPQAINTIETEVTIKETILDSTSNSSSFIRICGYYYNINDAGGATGDIFAMLMIGDRGNGGLEAFWEVQEMLSDDTRTWAAIGTGTVIGPGILQYNTPYTLKLAFEILETQEGRFSFKVEEQLHTFTGPFRKRDSVVQYKALSAAINAYGGENNGFVHGECDNVFVNNNSLVYDDFSTPLDFSRWKRLEWTRESKEGSLKANYQGIDSTGRVGTYMNRANADFIEAKVYLSDQSFVSPGALGQIRVQGHFYNDTRGPGSGLPYNRYEGNLFAKIYLQIDSNDNLACVAWLHRENNDSATSYTYLLEEYFTTPIYFNTEYVLSIRFIDNKLLFKCDNETISYDITTPKYPPYSEQKVLGLQTKLFLYPAGEWGYLQSSYDDVRVSEYLIAFCLQDYDFDNDMDGTDVVVFIQDPKDVSIEDFAMHFGRTDCP